MRVVLIGAGAVGVYGAFKAIKGCGGWVNEGLEEGRKHRQWQKEREVREKMRQEQARLGERSLPLVSALKEKIPKNYKSMAMVGRIRVEVSASDGRECTAGCILQKPTPEEMINELTKKMEQAFQQDIIGRPEIHYLVSYEDMQDQRYYILAKWEEGSWEVSADKKAIGNGLIEMTMQNLLEDSKTLALFLDDSLLSQIPENCSKIDVSMGVELELWGRQTTEEMYFDHVHQLSTSSERKKEEMEQGIHQFVSQIARGTAGHSIIKAHCSIAYTDENASPGYLYLKIPKGSKKVEVITGGEQLPGQLIIKKHSN
ncbi:MAG: hypothetical protein JSR80_06875 [Verrucomicrobia bacterium]|nr:hypothetical protein [Verrucomicrobiota bacterium]